MKSRTLIEQELEATVRVLSTLKTRQQKELFMDLYGYKDALEWVLNK